MRNRNYNTKALIEAGLITALTVVIMLINVYVPIISMFVTFILPIPITVLYIRHNYKVTLGSVIVSGILIAILYNPLSALTATILFGLTGLTLGYCIKYDKKVSTTITFLSIAIAIGYIANFFIYTIFIDKGGLLGFVNQVSGAIKQSIEINKSLYEKMGVPSNQIAMMEKSFEMITPDFLMRIMPFVIISTSVFSAYLNYTITRVILKKLKYEVKEIKPFTQLYITTRVGTLIAIFLVIGLLMNKKNMIAGQYIVTSTEIILQMIFLIDGLAVAAYYLKNKFNISKKIIVLILVFTTFSQLWVFYLYIGLADMLIDFRKLDPYRRMEK